MSFGSNQRLFTLGTFLLCGLGLIGCTGGSKSSATKSNTFYVNIQGEPKLLNPITAGDTYGREVHSYTMDSLMSRNEDTYEWQPGIAESYEVSKDGKTYTFKIRSDGLFHDGKPVTVQDVKFSFDVIFDDRFELFQTRPYYENIEKAEIADEHTIRFKVKKKYFLNMEVLASLTVVPKHVYEKMDANNKLNRELVGSGPYMLDKYEKGQLITLKKNPQWWGLKVDAFKNQYTFERVAMRFVNDETVALQMLKKGDLDFDPLNAESYTVRAVGQEWDRGDVVKVKTQNKGPKGFNYIGWNLRKELFKDKKVRIALTHLMNRVEMIRKFRFDMAVPATGPWYYASDYADSEVKAIPFDPEKAGKLLKEAGWSDSDKDGILDKNIGGKKVDLAFTLLYGNKETEKYWSLYQEDLKKAGINMGLQMMEWNTFLTKIDEANFDAVALGWGGGSVEIDPKQIWHSSSAVKGGSNFIAYKNPAVDKLIDSAREELDKSKRIPILRKVYRLIAEDAPYLFLFNDNYSLYAHTKRVKKERDTLTYGIGMSFWRLAN